MCVLCLIALTKFPSVNDVFPDKDVYDDDKKAKHDTSDSPVETTSIRDAVECCRLFSHISTHFFHPHSLPLVSEQPTTSVSYWRLDGKCFVLFFFPAQTTLGDAKL